MTGKAPNPTNNKGGTNNRTKSDEETRCVCGQQPLDHEGLMIQCEQCKVWQHCACVGILDEKDCPEQYFCEQCKPENHKYLQYCRSNFDINSLSNTKEVEMEVGAQPDGNSLDQDLKPFDQNELSVKEPLTTTERDANKTLKKESRAKRAKIFRNRSESPTASNRIIQESESDEEYLIRGERKKKKVNSKTEDGEYTLTASRGRKRDSKSHDHVNDESRRMQDEISSRKSTRKEKKEHCKDDSSGLELEFPTKSVLSNDNTLSNGRRKKSRKGSPEQTRYNARAKEHRRSPTVRVRNVSSRMSFQDMSRRTKQIFDCISRIQISMAEKAKRQSTVDSESNNRGEEPTTMEIVEGLTRKLVQFQELYGEMR